jgi:nitrous oxidase accessory protein
MKNKLFISLLLSCLMLIPALLSAQQIRVSPEGEVRSIKAAVEMAQPGDHILVEAGTYLESEIEINKPLTLEGVERPVIDGDREGNILIIRADSVTVKGFMIKNTGRSYVRDYSAILLENSKDFLIEDNDLDNVYFGIYLAETDRGIVRGNRIESYDRREASSGNGIHLWSVRNPKILDNTVMGMRDGIYLEFAKGAEISGNRSNDNNRYGLHFMFSDDSIYRDNIFRRNGAGVAVMYSKNVDMTGNLFEHNWGSSSYGLLLKDMQESRIERNRFYRNTVGIYSESSSNIEVQYNNFELNGYAVNIKSSSRDNRFTNNNFIENSFDVTTDSPRNPNTFDGNYWSHYEGYDLDRDGIGDVPYRPVRLFSVITQRQPESLILLRSMLITLLDTAERIMPVLTPQALTDEHPKMERIQ